MKVHLRRDLRTQLLPALPEGSLIGVDRVGGTSRASWLNARVSSTKRRRVFLDEFLQDGAMWSVARSDPSIYLTFL